MRIRYYCAGLANSTNQALQLRDDETEWALPAILFNINMRGMNGGNCLRTSSNAFPIYRG